MNGPVKTLLTLLFMISCTTRRKEPPAGNYLNDLVLYEQILQAAHAGLYNYRSKAGIDSIFDHYNTIVGRQAVTVTELYKYLCRITTFIGSLHDDVYLPAPVKDSLRLQKGFFPYPVKIIDNRLVMNLAHAAIPLGADILSINGHSAAEMLEKLGHYYTTDGYNLSGKKVGIESLFSWFYSLEYGMPDMFKATYRPYGDTAILQAALQPVSYGECEKLSGKRHSRYLDTLLDGRYDFEWAAANTALLTVNTFALGNEASASHKAYKKFLDSVFTLLRHRPGARLVVDIRKNGGGDDPNDLLTFSYLAYQPFRENREAYTLFQRLPFRQHYVAEDASDIPDLEWNFREEHNRPVNGKYYQAPSFNPLWRPSKLAFHGRAYLLVGPEVASAASLFASMVRSEGEVTIIGEETMGGYYWHTGHNSVTYRLPASGIEVMMSVVNVKQYVRPLKNIPPGRGIMPDIPLQQDMKGFMNNSDRVLEYAIRLAQAG